MERFFFYGTLQRGGGNWRALGIARRARFLGTDRVAGRLFDLGPYPAALLGPPGTIRGELFEAVDPGLIADLDALEGYDPRHPERSEYLRRRVTTRNGTACWAYHYRALPRHARAMPAGVWPAAR
ncbi:gamma-glutamylcyclotransferase family protein [Stakelama tenebrarum]|uniref:Gamma-glutamylcyclotransferase n=1 Tax=Stakelama tenebrarum TaxID=2711215 RepID=A0A6G6Y4Y6_9SPHN|nr:gamma-glutamylcyclotransferase family protein [Sphingosinithalassobacter tenebrarum]QIG80014.1 gamma-glutamylcyclotransferase [Sphingosinithalassobacter tenebrarum]